MFSNKQIKTKMENKYSSNEQAEKLKLIEQEKMNQLVYLNTAIKQHKYTEDRWDAYDVSFVSASTATTSIRAIGEIKLRTYTLAYFEKRGAYLEQKKYVSMWNKREHIKSEFGIDVMMFYFNFTSDGAVQLFHLPVDRLKYTWVERWLPIDDYTPGAYEYKTVHELNEKPYQVFWLK